VIEKAGVTLTSKVVELEPLVNPLFSERQLDAVFLQGESA
jgi:hypothetical protein